MSEIILHHYPMSPFAEKVRVALGLKGLSWHSVIRRIDEQFGEVAVHFPRAGFVVQPVRD